MTSLLNGEKLRMQAWRRVACDVADIWHKSGAGLISSNINRSHRESGIPIHRASNASAFHISVIRDGLCGNEVPKKTTARTYLLKNNGIVEMNTTGFADGNVVGVAVLNDPRLNKGTAFTDEKRR